MAEQEKYYRVLDADGLTVTDEKGREHHLKAGRVVPRSTFAQITWLLDGKHVEEADAPPSAVSPPPASRVADSVPPPDSSPPDEVA